jgi:outer membrane biogenesis lipoprotein LolB
MLRVVLMGALLLLSSCATRPQPKPPVAPLSPGKETETLLSPISVAIKAGEQSSGGRGYLIFKRPDRFHLVILSPLGTALFEVFTEGERITCLIPARDTAYRGLVSDLPELSPLKGWGLMRWVAERPPAAGPVPGVVEYTNGSGSHERVHYDAHGLVQWKENEEGDKVVYSDYEEMNGVALPRTVELYGRSGESVRIVFEEPEVNQPVEDAALTPNLEGMKILPLADFKGW